MATAVANAGRRRPDEGSAEVGGRRRSRGRRAAARPPRVWVTIGCQRSWPRPLPALSVTALRLPDSR